MKSKRTIFFIAIFGFISTLAAEIQFARQPIQVGEVNLEVEVAITQEQLSTGLMNRKSLSNGMLFIFSAEETRHFWMKNTFVPLSIGFFNSNFELIDIQDMEPVKSRDQVDIPSYQSRKPARYALEMPKGWFKTHKIKLGTKLKYPIQTKVQSPPKARSPK
jgi:uncharacterized protein